LLNNFRKQIQQSHGYAVAEFAITLPALIGVFSICLWVIGLGVTKIELENISNNAARTIARGESINQDKLPTGLKLEVIQQDSQITAHAKIVRDIPIIKRTIELSATAHSISEIYDSN
jgi:uncharacterized membrane protein (Fun14 family)